MSGILQSRFWVPAAALLLDNVATSLAAYSTRKLRGAYAGTCMKVRRSSDNTTQDIGFSSNELDQTALLSFCGAGNGFVDTWYDQGPNGYNVTNATQATQPQIVSSGSVVVKNTKPALLFTAASTQKLETGAAAVSLGGTTLTGSIVGAVTSSAANYADMLSFIANGQANNFDNAGSMAVIIRANNVAGFWPYRNNSAFALCSLTYAQMATMLTVADGTNCTPYADGAAGSSGAMTASFAATGMIRIGTSGNAMDGHIGEAILWATALGSTDRTNLQSGQSYSQKNYWGTP